MAHERRLPAGTDTVERGKGTRELRLLQPDGMGEGQGAYITSIFWSKFYLTFVLVANPESIYCRYRTLSSSTNNWHRACVRMVNDDPSFSAKALLEGWMEGGIDDGGLFS